jgi:hypothetical protein
MPVALIPFWQTWLFGWILVPALLILTALFIRQCAHLARERTRRGTAGAVPLAVGIAIVSGVIGYGIYVSYLMENTWHFSYYVTVQGGPQADAVVVPSVGDESLLSGLALSQGTANWSFVNTIHGRGLYIGFVGNATLSVFIDRFPPPNPAPNTSLTMVNGTGWWSPVWIYHARSTPLSLSVFETYVGTGTVDIQAGWKVYPMSPAP